MHFLLKKILLNGVQEEHGFMKIFVGTYMAPYFRNYLSLTVKIDMTYCVACMPTKKNDKSTDATDFCDGRPPPKYSTTDYLIFLCVRINFIDTWLNVLAIFFAWCCCAY